jgi:uncharacterized membrane protein YfcA
LLLAGVIAAYAQHGYLPGGDRIFPLAGVHVPVWHLLWMGFWTGYIMALVGQAAGIFALPYSTSVLQFDNPHVTPTILVLTFFNPMGALLGFRRSGQWNLDFAAPVCAGGLVGGVIGPFARATVLAEPENFRITLGIALALCGLQLCYRALADYARSRPGMGLRFFGRPDTSVSEQTPAPFRIETTFRSLFRIGIRYDSGMRELSNLHLFVTGLAVGIFSSALGVGGGFLLVPIFALVWRLPIYVMVAASIPYAVVLSLAGIITFMFVLPLVGAPPIDPEWSWGLFAAAGGVLGSWCASKTQVYVAEQLLRLFLGVVTGLVGLFYVLNAVAHQ